MYPGHGAPYRFDFPEARAGVERIRKMLEEGVVVKHPDGGKASIKGYADGIWLGFGQIAQGLWLHIQMTGDEAVSQSLSRIMWAICGFEISVGEDGSIGFVRYQQLKDALDNLENMITTVPNRWTLEQPGGSA